MRQKIFAPIFAHGVTPGISRKTRQIRKGSHVASSLSTSRRHTKNSRPVASLARTWASELQLRQIITPNQPQHQSRSGVSTSHAAKIIFKAAARGPQNPRQRQTKLFASQALAPCSGLAHGSGISMPSSFALALTTLFICSECAVSCKPSGIPTNFRSAAKIP